MKELMKKSQYVTNTVSYKGKNLNEVVAVLETNKLKVAKDKK